MKEFEGDLQAKGKRFAIVASRFNESIVEPLVKGAHGTLRKLGAAEESISVFHVPGAFEIPPVASRLARSGKFDAVICLGAVIRGATPHFEHVAGEASRGIAEASRAGRVPVIFGVLTTDTIEQAMERAGTKSGNKGSEAAMAAVQMSNLHALLDQEIGK
ncbi:MAG TPA: 6,7-dimethyl-8-ribityllumazine synthase [Planctomycetota bacterium]|nr:6,7-dimethyl-8-ribityllumazine synthase [Planctomycetota bacterium]